MLPCDFPGDEASGLDLISQRADGDGPVRESDLHRSLEADGLGAFDGFRAHVELPRFGSFG